MTAEVKTKTFNNSTRALKSNYNNETKIRLCKEEDFEKVG
jgi:hypothetical protein